MNPVRKNCWEDKRQWLTGGPSNLSTTQSPLGFQTVSGTPAPQHLVFPTRVLGRNILVLIPSIGVGIGTWVLASKIRMLQYRHWEASAGIPLLHLSPTSRLPHALSLGASQYRLPSLGNHSIFRVDVPRMAVILKFISPSKTHSEL